MIGPAFALPRSTVGTPRVQPEIERYVKSEYSERNCRWFLRELNESVRRLVSKPSAFGRTRLRRRIPSESIKGPTYKTERSVHPSARFACEDTLAHQLLEECAECAPKFEITERR